MISCTCVCTGSVRYGTSIANEIGTCGMILHACTCGNGVGAFQVCDRKSVLSGMVVRAHKFLPDRGNWAKLRVFLQKHLCTERGLIIRLTAVDAYLRQTHLVQGNAASIAGVGALAFKLSQSMHEGYGHTHMNFELYVYINNFGAADGQSSKYIHAQLRPKRTAAATRVVTTGRLNEVSLLYR